MPAMSIDANTTSFITVPEVMRNANISTADSSTTGEIDLMREAAQDVVESIIGPVLWRTVTENLPVTGPDQRMMGTNSLAVGEISLTVRPVVSVTTITAAGSPAALTYTLDPATGILTGVGPWPWVSWHYANVTYVAGRTTCPSAVRLATLIIATNLWQTQLGNQAPAAQGAFDTGEQRLDVAQFMAGYSIPPRAIELLTPYRIDPILVA